MAEITSIEHPEYTANIQQWEKYRATYTGGKVFRDKYLKRFSDRETNADFQTRKEMTYVPAFAKAAVIEIKNAIFSRMIDVKRIEGPSTYKQVIDGTSPGVDREDGSMNAFMGGQVLPELLAMKKVGIFVDQPSLDNPTGTKMDDIGRVPYAYLFTAEAIKTWNYDEDNNLQNVLLEATVDAVDEETGLVSGQEKEYRKFVKVGDGVEVTIYNADSEEKKSTTTYSWTQIPLVILEIPESLLADVADYQIAHLNIASSDVTYAWKSNFPFYTEQINPRQGAHMRKANSDGTVSDGTADKTKTAADPDITVGAVKGRRYAKDLDRPNFIHPSPEPLKVSMEKQDAIKTEIRQLVQLSVTNMDPRRESAESKSMDERGLEAGLSYIAQELERGERQIVQIWAMYDSSGEQAQIKYPQDYSLKTTSDRLVEGEKLIELSKTSPSTTYQKSMAKLSAEVILGNRTSADTLETIYKEIDNASVVYVDPESLVTDVETGLATTATVSEIRGYPQGEAAKAKIEREERAAAIVKAQTAAKGDSMPNAAARGVPELDPEPNTSPDEEKKLSQSRDTSLDKAKGVRG
jgi:hypothetical protein